MNLHLQCLVKSTVDAIKSTGANLGSETFEYQLHGRMGKYEFYFPIYISESHLDGQALLLRGRNTVWHRGRFQDSFRDLNDAVTRLRLGGASWNDAETRVSDAEANSSTESFEAFGMKIPAGFSIYFAVIIVLSVQAYLLAQLHEFCSGSALDSLDSDGSWIGAYSSGFARVLFGVSTILLPATACVMLGLRGIRANGFHPSLYCVVALVAVLSSALGVMAYRDARSYQALLAGRK